MHSQTIRAEVYLQPEPLRLIQIPDTVRRAQSGDQRAFERIYKENVGRVYAVCLRIVADQTRAEELTQDVFVRLWQMIKSFRGESAFSSWLHRIAVNVVLSDFRSAKRRTAHVTSTDDLTDYDTEESSAPPGFRMDLEQGISALPKRARAVFVLHDIEGYKHHEIAAMMDVSTGTSKSQLHRARKLLKEMLQ